MMPDPDPHSNVPGMHLPGWVQATELTWLATQATHMRSIVEIGSFKGRSTYALASTCPGTVYAIDPWEPDTPEYDGTNVFAFWQDNVGSVLPNTVPIIGRSPAAGTLIPDPIDMVWIDGSHNHADVAADITYWLPRAETLLCGHDYLTFDGVRQAVDELLGDTARVIPGTWIWAVGDAVDT